MTNRVYCSADAADETSTGPKQSRSLSLEHPVTKLAAELASIVCCESGLFTVLSHCVRSGSDAKGLCLTGQVLCLSEKAKSFLKIL